jgi:malic enzyme
VFYAAIPLAFAVADPVSNALPAAVLLASFIGTGSSFWRSPHWPKNEA